MNIEKLLVSALSWQDLSEEFGKAFDLHHEVSSLNAIHGNRLLQDNTKSLTNNGDEEVEHEHYAEVECSTVEEEVNCRFINHFVILATCQQVDLILSNFKILDLSLGLAFSFLNCSEHNKSEHREEEQRYEKEDCERTKFLNDFFDHSNQRSQWSEYSQDKESSNQDQTCGDHVHG